MNIQILRCPTFVPKVVLCLVVTIKVRHHISNLQYKLQFKINKQLESSDIKCGQS